MKYKCELFLSFIVDLCKVLFQNWSESWSFYIFAKDIGNSVECKGHPEFFSLQQILTYSAKFQNFEFRTKKAVFSASDKFENASRMFSIYMDAAIIYLIFDVLV